MGSNSTPRYGGKSGLTRRIRDRSNTIPSYPRGKQKHLLGSKRCSFWCWKYSACLFRFEITEQALQTLSCMYAEGEPRATAARESEIREYFIPDFSNWKDLDS